MLVIFCCKSSPVTAAATTAEVVLHWPGPEIVPADHGTNDRAFYVRRWWPSKYEVDCLQEIYVTDLSLDTAIRKVPDRWLESSVTHFCSVTLSLLNRFGTTNGFCLRATTYVFF